MNIHDIDILMKFLKTLNFKNELEKFITVCSFFPDSCIAVRTGPKQHKMAKCCFQQYFPTTVTRKFIN